MSFKFDNVESDALMALPHYRWVVRKDTHTDAPRLQQSWVNRRTGEVVWRAVETAVVDDEEFYR